MVDKLKTHKFLTVPKVNEKTKFSSIFKSYVRKLVLSIVGVW